ncbi:MAG: 30S ribosomal protein S8 [Clostridia bacterium]
MMMTDPIADMLTRIRNGLTARHDSVDVPYSKIKKSILDILANEGFINGLEVIEGGVQEVIKVNLKYGAKKEKVVTGIKRISKPGLRVYVDSENLPKVLGGMGIAIISTSRGIMTDKQARQAHVGGEVLAYVW